MELRCYESACRSSEYILFDMARKLVAGASAGQNAAGQAAPDVGAAGHLASDAGGAGQTAHETGGAGAAGSGMDAGSSTPVPAQDGIASLGAACATELERACAGHASFEVLVCMDGRWKAGASCAAGTRCDTRDVPTRGTCQQVLALCDGRTTLDVCDGWKRLSCGADLLDSAPNPCPENSTCAMQSGVAVCACNAGTYTDAQGACIPICAAGACGQHGVCEPGTRQDEYTCTCDREYIVKDRKCIPRFQQNSDGTVTDRSNGFTSWQQPVSNGLYTWAAANQYCAGLTLGGHQGWELPNVKGLCDVCSDVQSDESPFEYNADGPLFWSSVMDSTNEANAVSCRGGSWAFGPKPTSDMYRVRCVYMP